MERRATQASGTTQASRVSQLEEHDPVDLEIGHIASRVYEPVEETDTGPKDPYLVRY